MTELEYDLTPEDFLAFNEQYVSTASGMRPLGKRFRIQMTLWVPLLSAIVLTLMLRSLWFAVCVALVSAIVVWFISPAIFAHQVRRNIKTMAKAAPLGSTGHHVLRIEQEGLREFSPVGELLVPWRNIVNVEDSTTHTYVWFGPTQAFVVPGRIDAQQLKQFRDVLQYHLAQSRSSE